MQTEQIMSTVRDLVGMAPRATGTPGGERAAAYVADRFRTAGLSDVHHLEVPSYAWHAERCTVSLGSPDDVLEVPSSPILHSALPAHDAVGTLVDRPVTAPVVDIGSDAVGAHQVRGRILLFDLTFDMSAAHLLPFTEWIHDPGRRLLRRDVLAARNPYVTSLTRVVTDAAAAGALGVIGVLRDYPESVGYHNEYYRRSLLSLPGAWVTRRSGELLRVRLARDPGAELTLDLAVERREVTSRTVVGMLPGRSPETVMIQSHHDSVGPGAVEDATGTAEVIALAEHFAARAAAGQGLEKTLMFVTFDTHFTGYQAHQEFARRYLLARDSPHDIVLNLTVEHVGLRAVRGDDGGFAVLAETEPRGIFENVNLRLKAFLARGLRRHGMGATSLLNASLLEYGRFGIPTDASFVLLSGVPVVSLISGPLYLYDDADTLEMVDVDQLVPVARYFADVVERVDRVPAGRIGLVPRRLRQRLPRGRW